MDRPIELPLTDRRAASWRADMGRRIVRHLLLKVVGISGFMWVFFIAYFHLLRHPLHPVTQMPLTALDELLPFQPGWLPVYLSLWLYVGIVPGLLMTLRELIAYGLWATGLCLTGLACFYFWPTEVPALTLDVSGYAGFAMLQGVDAAGNACPSMHVAGAMFSALWLDRLLHFTKAPAAWRWANIAWVAAITYSTFAIRQHVVLDAVAGAVLGSMFAAASLRWGVAFTAPRPQNRC